MKGRTMSEHFEQATAAPGETRDAIPPFPTLDNIELTDAELADVGRAFLALLREARRQGI